MQHLFNQIATTRHQRIPKRHGYFVGSSKIVIQQLGTIQNVISPPFTENSLQKSDSKQESALKPHFLFEKSQNDRK